MALREWVHPVPDQVIVAEGMDENWSGRVLREPDPFEAAGVWEGLGPVRRPQVVLATGGSMAVEATRALVAVDVTHGR